MSIKKEVHPTKPLCSRYIKATAEISVLPWELWSLLTDSSRISSLTESLVHLNPDLNTEGFIKFKHGDSQTKWLFLTTKSVEFEYLKFHLIGNSWNLNNELDQTLSIDMTNKFEVILDGFYASNLSDGMFFSAGNWLWLWMSKVVKELGADPFKCLQLETGIICQKTFKLQPEKLREMILTPDKAVSWLAEEVNIETREGGKFKLRWERVWGELALNGVLKTFKPDLLEVSIKENPFGDLPPLLLNFKIDQISENDTKLIFSIHGIPSLSGSSFAPLLLSDLMTQALLSLSIIVSKCENIS